MRFGLVGTGHWARQVHGPALAAEPVAELVGVWGRDPDRTAALAAALGATAYREVEALVDAVEAVAFAVPPDLQADLASRAAGAGRHLLLEKPVATDVAAAERLAGAVEDAGVASVVFFTSRFSEPHRRWLAGLAGGDWRGGSARWISSALAAGSPYAASRWRQQKGALWDVGPHALSLLEPALGPVVAVTADAGAGDLVHLVAHHDGGATSTLTMTLQAPAAADDVSVSLWGEPGWTSAPAAGSSPLDALRLAVRELVASVGGPPHSCGVRYGVSVVRTLAGAETQLHRR